MPRPPEMTISASVSSGRPVETSSRRSTSFILAAGILTLGFSTVPLLPAWLSAGLQPLGRRVATHGALAHVIFPITFLGEPFRSSSTMHQYALAISDRLRVLAQRADELFRRVLHLALDDPARRPRRQRLEVLHGELRGGGREPEVAGLHVLDLLLLGAHDPLQRRVARLVEPLLRRAPGRQRAIEHTEPPLSPASHAHV